MRADLGGSYEEMVISDRTDERGCIVHVVRNKRARLQRRVRHVVLEGPYAMQCETWQIITWQH